MKHVIDCFIKIFMCSDLRKINWIYFSGTEFNTHDLLYPRLVYIIFETKLVKISLVLFS